MEKSYEQLEKDKKEKQKKKSDYEWQIANLNEWKELWESFIKQAELEIKLKKVNPLPIEPEYEFEKLPQWKDHMAKSYELGIRKEILSYKAEIYQIESKIKMIQELIDEGERNE